jgi:putative transposase
VLAEAGIPPAPQRDRQSWCSFLRQQGESILACDFLTVDTVWHRRLYVLVFLSIGSRRVEYLASTSNPETTWMLQQARNLLMDIDDRGRQVRFLLHDGDSKLAAAFDAVFAGEGIVYVRHYNHGRPHRALNLQPPEPSATAIARGDPRAPLTDVHRRDLLSGLIHEYELAPAA